MGGVECDVGKGVTPIAVRWVGAVLTGGSSHRMGRDKATLELGGVAMAVRVASALQEAGADEVVCVGPAVGALKGIGEDELGAGPLGAIVAAIRWADGRAVAIGACDLIHPSAEVFAAVVNALGDREASVPRSAGRLQPLVAAYAPGALPLLAAAFARGERSITAALSELDVAELRDIQPGALADADEPGDLGR
ncbi:MAG: molybdenum cofactor guanylyltransferase [Acidimicrobiales bacterium]